MHHPLVDAVGAHLQHRVVQGARGNAQQFFAHRWHAHRLFHALPFIGVQADAPQVLEPQQAEGALLAPAIVDEGQIGQVIVKRKVRGRQDGGLGKGMAFKRQIQLFAHLAAPAIGPHQKSATDRQGFATRCAVAHIDMAIGLAERDQGVPHQHLHVRQVARNLRHQQLRQTPLFALQAIGVGCFVFEDRHIKLRKLTRGVHAHLPGRGNQALLDQAGRDAVFVQHVQGGWVKGRSAQIAVDVGIGLEHHTRNAPVAQAQSQHQAHRACARDDDGWG